MFDRNVKNSVAGKYDEFAIGPRGSGFLFGPKAAAEVNEYLGRAFESTLSDL